MSELQGNWVVGFLLSILYYRSIKLWDEPVDISFTRNVENIHFLMCSLYNQKVVIEEIGYFGIDFNI